MSGSRTKTHAAVTHGGSALSRYQQVIVGRNSFTAFLYFEFCACLGPIPGALGLALRKLFWPRLFARCGAGTVFGRGITLRHPSRIVLGKDVVIGDYVTLDGRSSVDDPSISVGDEVMIADYCSLTSKDGVLKIGDRVGLGTGTLIQATSGCSADIGDDVVIGPHCYVVGGGNYDTSAVDELIRIRPIRQDGGCLIESNVWLGAKVAVLDGAHVASGSIVASGAVVLAPIPAFVVCGGVPAKVIKDRTA